jgi:hypothetical protein
MRVLSLLTPYTFPRDRLGQILPPVIGLLDSFAGRSAAARYSRFKFNDDGMNFEIAVWVMVTPLFLRCEDVEERLGDDRLIENLRSERLSGSDRIQEASWSWRRTVSQNMTHAPFESACTAWTSWERSCDCYDQASLMERRDRVGNVTLGPDRRRCGVGNYWEWQAF